MKRILIDCTAATARITGLERYAREVGPRVAKLAVAKGYDAQLLLPKLAPGVWGEAQDDYQYSVRRSPWRSRLLTEQVWIPGAVAAFRPDVCFFPGFPPSPLVVLGARQRRVFRTIFDAVMWRKAATISWKNRLYMKPLETFGSHRYAGIHTISEFSQQEIEKALPWLAGKVIVSGIGTDASARRMPEDDGSEVIRRWDLADDFLLFVGTLEPRKNLPFLIRVLARVAAQRPGVQLVLAGRLGWGTSEVLATIEALGLKETVKILGPVSDADLRTLYRHARALVYPSLYEGFGLPVVEAMADGVPVVSSNGGALPEAAGDAAILLAPDDENGWVEAIERVLSSAEMRAALIERGLAQAGKFAWDAVAERIVESL